MNFSKDRTMKLLGKGLLLVCMLLHSACTVEMLSSRKPTGDAESNREEPKKPENNNERPAVKVDPPEIFYGMAKMKTGAELMATYYTITGLTRPNAAMATYYAQNSTTFSGDGNAKNISSSMLLKGMELGSIACRGWTDSAAANPDGNIANQVFEGLNLATGLRNSFNVALRQQVAARIAERAYGRSATEEELLVILEGINQVIPGLNNNNAGLRLAVTTLCTIILSSLDAVSNS